MQKIGGTASAMFLHLAINTARDNQGIPWMKSAFGKILICKLYLIIVITFCANAGKQLFLSAWELTLALCDYQDFCDLSCLALGLFSFSVKAVGTKFM